MNPSPNAATPCPTSTPAAGLATRPVAGDGALAGHHGGFTLVELLIVVAVVSILSAIAYPMYDSQLTKSQRVEARTALMRSAQMLERSFTQNAGYPETVAGFNALYGVAAGSSVYSDVERPGNQSRAHFRLDYVPGAAPGPGLAPLAYTVRATPLPAARVDADCGTYSLNDRGQQTVTGPNPNNVCWR